MNDNISQKTEAKNRRGRPNLQHKIHMVYARMTESELELLDLMCKKTFATRSSCLRRALYETLRREGYLKENE